MKVHGFEKGSIEKGSILVLAAILIPAVLATLGLVIDNGASYEARRRLQKAVDAGAIAAAQEMRRGSPASAYQAAALDSAARNGFSGAAATVEVFNPPVSGPRKGDAAFIEVVGHTPAPRYFMKALYVEPYDLEARAVSGAMPSRMCILALNKTASGSLDVAGNAHVDIPGCTVQVNSSATNAAQSGGSSYVKASGVDVVGNYSGTGFTPTPFSGSPSMDDPLASLAAPATGGACTANNLKVNTSVTLDPGKYCGGIDVVAGATVTLRPGMYVLAGGGLTVRGGATIQGDEVTIYNTTGPYSPIIFGGGSVAKLSAPKTGPYKGILFFGDRTATSGKANEFTGTTGSYLTGTFYFPSTPVRLVGDAGMQGQKMLVLADKVEFQGNVSFSALRPEDGVPQQTVQAALVY